MHRLKFALLALSLLGCAQPLDPAQAARDALRDRDASTALELFDQALQQPDLPSEAVHYLHLDRVVAQGIVDSGEVCSALEAFRATSTLEPRDYKEMVAGLVLFDAHLSAHLVTMHARMAFPDDPTLERLDRIVIEAAAKDPATREWMSTLGYIPHLDGCGYGE